MADHDLAAELQGYRNELEQCEAAGKSERASAVREEIRRVEDEARTTAEDLERQADDFEGQAQDVRATEARVEARRYRELADGEDRSAPTADADTGSSTTAGADPSAARDPELAKDPGIATGTPADRDSASKEATAKRGPGRPRKETAQDKTPKETA